MIEKDLKQKIDGIEEKIRVLTEEKMKCYKEYNHICNLNEFLKILKEDKKGCRRFGIGTDYRKNIKDKKPYTYITTGVGNGEIAINIKYPLSVDFDREFRELLYKYLNNSNESVFE